MILSLYNSRTARKLAFVNFGNVAWGKKNIFCLWKLDSHGLKPARKAHTYSFLWSSFLFSKRNRLFATFAWKSSDSSVSSNQGNDRYGTQDSKNTLPRPLFLWNGAVCPKSLYTALKLHGNMFCELGIWCLMAKESFSLVKFNSCRKKLSRKTLVSFFFSSQQQLWSSFCFLKEKGCLPLLLKGHLTVQFHLFRVTIVLAVSAHRPLSHDHFSHVMVQCVLGVSLQNSEDEGMRAFVNLTIGP